MRERSLLVGSLTVLVAAAGFGILGPLARLSYATGLEPFSFVAWRAAFGTLVVVLYVAWRRSGGRSVIVPWHLPRPQAAALGVAALVALILNIAMFVAFQRTTVALALLAFYTYPAMVAVVAVVRGHERLDGPRVGALGLALVGMVLVVAGGLSPTGELRLDVLGIGLALLAALSQTIFVTISRGSYRAVPTEQAMGWIIAPTVVICAFLAVATGAADALLVPLRSPQALGLTAVAGIVAAGIPSILFLTGIRTIGGTRTGILMLFEPVVGVVLAAVLLNERVAPVQILGGIAILAAALLLQRPGGPVVEGVQGIVEAADDHEGGEQGEGPEVRRPVLAELSERS
jgi:drug/metabolite transporter (DMT)-like permease